MHTILKALRKKKNLRQDDVARKLCITSSAYAKIEQGKNKLVEAYYDTLADLFELDSAELFQLYHSSDENLPDVISGGRIRMKIDIANEVDFGTVEIANYRYVNFCQGPDFLKFRLPAVKAKKFIEKIRIDYDAINEALKKIEPGREDIDSIICEPDDDDPGYVDFIAYLTDDFEVNGRELGANWGINVLDKIDAPRFKVVCSIVIRDTDFGEVFHLKLDSVEVENKADLFEGLPEPSNFAFADLPEDMYVRILSEKDKIRSIDELIEMGKEYNYDLEEKNARTLMRDWIL